MTESFEVVPIRDAALPGSPPRMTVAFLREVAELDRAVQGAEELIKQTETRINAIQDALMRSTAGDTGLDDEARSLELRLKALQLELVGSKLREDMGDRGPVSIKRRVEVARMGNRFAMYGPTPTHRRSLQIADEQFEALREKLEELVERNLVELEQRLEAAGVPWTPGRSVPGGQDTH